MRIHKSIIRIFDNQRGAVAIITAVVTLFVILGVAALAIDIGRVAAAKNELQNAADGGALAGTDKLYLHSVGNSPVPNTQAIIEQAAWAVAIQNYHTGSLSNSDINVERGHWRFGVINGGFSPFTGGNGVRLLDPSELFDYIIKLKEKVAHHEVLNKFDGKTLFKGEYPFFINAVRVSIGDGSTPTLTNIFRKSDSAISASAVAYIGPAGGWQPGDFDAPVAICQETLTGEFCHIARMMEDSTSGDTAQWTDFSMPCSGGASANSIEQDSLVECTGNKNFVPAGVQIGVTNGVAASIFDALNEGNKASLAKCWRNQAEENTLLKCDPSYNHDITNPTDPWSITLPVVNCTESNTCNTIVGAVSVDLLWITRNSNKPDSQAPCKMGDWEYNNTICGDLMDIVAAGGTIQNAVDHLKTYKPDPDYDLGFWAKIDATRWGQGGHNYTAGMARWDCFVRHFNVRSPSNNPAHFSSKTIYFAPNCETVEAGNPGVGVEFYGVFSETSVLVK